MSKKILITGGAGFIGSNIALDLVKKKKEVVVYDNLSTGNKKNLKNIIKNKYFTFINADLLNKKKLNETLKNIDIVYHFAANADIQNTFKNPKVDFNQNILCTFNLLEAMRKNNVKKILFASSSAVYGEPKKIPTPENIKIPIQTSLYGAAKLSSEQLISAYCSGYNFKAVCFRFVSLVGPYYTHGHLIDFIKQLKLNKSKLLVLGDGLQRKSYLHILDAINAINLASKYHLNSKNIIAQNFNVYNIGNNSYIKLNVSINLIIKLMKLNPIIKYTGGKRGWKGDNPFVFLNTNKISKIGWMPKYTVEQAITKTVKWLIDNNG